jgi:hypothetical protein
MRFAMGLFPASLVAFPLHAQFPANNSVDSPVPPVEQPYKSPHRALILGTIIPGAGHIYAGEYLKGFLTYEGTVSTIGMGVMTYIIDDCTFAFTTSCKAGPQWPHQALGIAVVGIGLRMWLSSARDASLAAERANERHRRKWATFGPIVDPFAGPSNASQIGVSVEW